LSLSRGFGMKKVVIILVGILVLTGAFLGLRTIPVVRQGLDNYAINTMTDCYGKTNLKPEYEATILAIAHEMGISEPIVIRKMSSIALQKFGYYNAFVAFALLFDVIPYSNQPFMFVSEGFFEDLSPEEQRFLIGHELIHIRERHTMFVNLVKVLFTIILLLPWYCAVLYFRRRFAERTILMVICVYLLLCVVLVIPKLATFNYLRYMEKIADCESLKLLNTHEGCLKLLKRWETDFKMAHHHDYYGILADHPSNYERKCYCLELQKESKKN